MGLPLRALRNPGAKLLDLSRSQLQTGVTRWHPKPFVRGSDAADHFTGRRVPRNYGPPVFAEVCCGGRLAVQTQGNTFGRGVGAVAVQALVRKNRTDVPIKLDGYIRSQTVPGAEKYCE